MKRLYNLFIFLICFLPFNISNGQRPNTKKVEFKYVQPPSSPLPENVKTYHSSISVKTSLFTAPSNIRDNFGRLIELELKGYEQISSMGDADILIGLTINNVSWESKVEKAKYKQKINDSTYVDKEGGRYFIKASMNYSKTVKDVKNDKFLMSDVLTKSNGFTSNILPSYNQAIKERNNTLSYKRNNLYNQLFLQAKNDFKYVINDVYGYPLKRLSQPIARGKGRKHDYSDLQKAFDLFKNSSNNYNGHDISEGLEKSILECIKIWDIAIKQYVPKKRRARIGDRIIGELYFNRAYAYFVLRDWNQVYSNLSKAKEFKGLKKVLKNLELITNNLDKRYALQ